MNKEQLISKLQIAIAKGNLENTIEYFIKNLKLFDNYLVNSFIHISANFESAKSDYSKQLIDDKDWRQAKAKTTSALLMVLDNLPENANYPELLGENLPQEEQKPKNQKPKSTNSHAQMIEQLLSEYKTKLILESDPRQKMATELEIERLEKLLEEL